MQIAYNFFLYRLFLFTCSFCVCGLSTETPVHVKVELVSGLDRVKFLDK